MVRECRSAQSSAAWWTGDGSLEARDVDGGEPVETEAADTKRRRARDIGHAEMVVGGTYATAGEMSVSSHRRYRPDRHRGAPKTVIPRRPK